MPTAASTLLPRIRRITDRAVLTPEQREKEQALFAAILLDASTYVFVLIAAISSGSLTMLAELWRGGLLFAIEIITVITLWRSHRGKFADFEYGIGKIERVISIMIAAGLFIAALYTVDAMLSRLSEPIVLPTSAMMLSVTAASYNLMINFYCIGSFSRANAQESSLILAAQIRSRLVKTVSSAVVVLIVVVATVLPDPKAATIVDAVGTLFAIVYMMVIGTQLFRESLPDLLDRSLPEHEQLLLMRVITRHFDDIQSLGIIKSRSSGGRSFIELELMFATDTPFATVNSLCQRVEQEVVSEIPDAVVSVKPRTAKQDNHEALAPKTGL
jgi:divalent metal cation (Fe/Co/Zn/Cd) transporter